MHDHEKSDRLIVPANSSNKAGSPAAEAGEGSGLGKENAANKTPPRTQSRPERAKCVGSRARSREQG